jgi:hypothetical protein
MQDGFRADPLCRPGSPAAVSYRSIMGVWPASYRRASAPACCPPKPSLALYLSPTPLKSCGAWRAPDGKPGQPGCRNAAGPSRARARVRANPPHASTGAGGWLAHPVLSPSLVRPKHVKQHCEPRERPLLRLRSRTSALSGRPERMGRPAGELGEKSRARQPVRRPPRREGLEQRGVRRECSLLQGSLSARRSQFPHMR